MIADGALLYANHGRKYWVTGPTVSAYSTVPAPLALDVPAPLPFASHGPSGQVITIGSMSKTLREAVHRMAAALAQGLSPSSADRRPHWVA